MLHKLPKEIDPVRFAQNGLQLTGALPLAKMSRLVQSLENSDGQVEVAIKFDIDEVGVPYMDGSFKASLSILCERCAKTMQLDVDTSCLLAIVSSDSQAANLADRYETWILENSILHLTSMVEDELILSLPLVAKHDYMCLSDTDWSTANEAEAESVNAVDSPFAVLATLKASNKQGNF